MSIKSFIASIFHGTTGEKLGEVVLSAVQHAVAIAKADTGLAGKIEAQIEAVANSELKGSEKRSYVVAAVAEDVLAFVADPSKAVADVIDFTHDLVQAVYNDAKSTTAGVIASIINAKVVASA